MDPSRRDDGEQFRVVEIFEHRGRTCVIVKVDHTIGLSEKFKQSIKTFNSMYPFYNGYVEVLSTSRRKNLEKMIGNIESEELTYKGKLDQYDESRLKGKIFVGFDTAHWYDMEHPERKTLEVVKQRTIDFCDEIVEKSL